MTRLFQREAAMAALAAGALLLSIVPAVQAANYRCLPSCAADDGRMLVLTDGAGLDTLTFDNLELEVRVPANRSSFTLGFFDGDLGGLWDLAFDATSESVMFHLYADPEGDGSGQVAVAPFPLSGSAMADNGWSEVTVANAPEALQPEGALYVYRLVVDLELCLPATRAAFKVRSDEAVSLALHGQQPAQGPREPGAFAFIAAMPGWHELETIYPDCRGVPLDVCLGSLGNTTYDGTFSLYMDLPHCKQELALWDGDLDYGSYDASAVDSDDFNTLPGQYPHFVTDIGRTAYWEGEAKGCCRGGERDGLACRPSPGADPYCPGGACDITGDPPDDFDAGAGDGLGAIFVREGAVSYDVLGPGGGLLGTCDNPSGNDEWELFRLAKVCSRDYLDDNGLPPDVDVSSLPPGRYEISIRDLDLENLNAFCLPYPARPNGGEQGCTPGYWKQYHHFGSWSVYTPQNRFEEIFGVDTGFGNIELRWALRLRGGGERALARHAVAALLNSASDQLNAVFTEAEVIQIVQDAYATGRFWSAKNRLESANELLCEFDPPCDDEDSDSSDSDSGSDSDSDSGSDSDSDSGSDSDSDSEDSDD